MRNLFSELEGWSNHDLRIAEWMTSSQERSRPTSKCSIPAASARASSGQSRENPESSDVITTKVVVEPTLSLSAPELKWTRGAQHLRHHAGGLGARMRA